MLNFVVVDGIKRKRGRPKGSTKKAQAEEQRHNKLFSPSKKEVSDVLSESPVKPQHAEDDTGLECKKCQRKFSNKRQISKHICFAQLKNVPDEDDLHSKSLYGYFSPLHGITISVCNIATLMLSR